jgi:hypothetical protein
VEDRISGLEDKIDIKKRREEYIDKRLKIWKRNMQELCDYIKSLNLRIMGIEEGDEVQAKGIKT